MDKIKITESEKVYSIPTDIPKLIEHLQYLQEQGWTSFEVYADCYINESDPFVIYITKREREETDKEFEKRTKQESREKVLTKKRVLKEIERLQKQLKVLTDE